MDESKIPGPTENTPTLEQQVKDLQRQKTWFEKQLALLESANFAAFVGYDEGPSDMDRQYLRLLDDQLQMCADILAAEKPQEEIQRMIEILIQRDDEWVEKEAGNDGRVLFFIDYFYQTHPGYENRLKVGVPFPKSKDVVQQLREKRFDKKFANEVVAKIPAMVAVFKEDRDFNQKFKDDEAQEAERSRKRTEKNKKELRAHIAEIDAKITTLQSK